MPLSLRIFVRKLARPGTELSTSFLGTGRFFLSNIILPFQVIVNIQVYSRETFVKMFW